MYLFSDTPCMLFIKKKKNNLEQRNLKLPNNKLVQDPTKIKIQCRVAGFALHLF